MGLMVAQHSDSECNITDYSPGEISGDTFKGGMSSSIPFTMRNARASQNELTSLKKGLLKLPRVRSAASLQCQSLVVCA